MADGGATYAVAALAEGKFLLYYPVVYPAVATREKLTRWLLSETTPEERHHGEEVEGS